MKSFINQYTLNMKLLLVLISILYSSSLLAEDKIHKLFDEKRFFELNEQIKLKNEEWKNSCEGKFYRAFIDNAFGKLKNSDSLINNILTTCNEKLPDSMKYLMYELLIDNYTKESKYKDALLYYKKLYAVDNDSITILKKDSYNNMIQLFEALADLPPLVVNTESKVYFIPFHRNGIGHYVIPVTRDNVTENFVFDSGANMSVLTQSMAKKMNIPILKNYNMDVGTSTEQMIKAQIGYAEDLEIGDLKIRHAVFLVLPDELLNFNAVSYKINGIIGYPIMREMGEMIIGKEGSLCIMPSPSYKNVDNLFMDGLSPILQTRFNGQTVQMLFDTGSTGSQLFKRFYSKYQKETELNGEKSDISIGGAGGITRVNCYTWKDFPITIANKNIRIPVVHVITDEMGNNKKVADGVIGQNVADQFDEMVLNLKDMYLLFRNRK